MAGKPAAVGISIVGVIAHIAGNGMKRNSMRAARKKYKSRPSDPWIWKSLTKIL